MNDYPSVFTRTDPETQRKRALAKVYDLLLKLAEEKEKETVEITDDKEDSELLKPNSSPGQ
jgi:hypothetical protein